jgi:CspA family cold shock protein
MITKLYFAIVLSLIAGRALADGGVVDSYDPATGRGKILAVGIYSFVYFRLAPEDPQRNVIKPGTPVAFDLDDNGVVPAAVHIRIVPASPPPSPVPSFGVLYEWNSGKGLGLIRPDGGGHDIAFDFKALSSSSAATIKALQAGMRVEFDVAQGPKGPIARNVRAVSAAPIAPAPTIKVSAGMTDVAGTVKSFNDAKGYGYITPDAGGADIFVTFAAIKGSGYKVLREGQKVRFDVQSGPKGLQAANVR